MRPTDPEEQFVGGKQFKRKSTKKWCRGKVGREHVPVVVLDTKRYSYAMDSGKTCGQPVFRNSTIVSCYHHEICSACGKELKFSVDICPVTGLARESRWW